ncbi:hypothetical protein ACGILS_19765 [Streptomyces albidoflavus]|uniref:hypothetical protein n=1 Tax=Streptomyces albidoflavus TaxID=1886 RepID=UPI0021D58FA3|nr:hypothetical protein [Streptomyces albidoflavus]MCU7702937.1 hypothetical protein [Streptomyces albidoflavus]
MPVPHVSGPDPAALLPGPAPARAPERGARAPGTTCAGARAPRGLPGARTAPRAACAPAASTAARSAGPAPGSTAVRWAAFGCVLAPVVLVVYGASAGGVMWVAPVLAAVTGICRLLLRRAERGGATGSRSAAGDVPR